MYKKNNMDNVYVGLLPKIPVFLCSYINVYTCLCLCVCAYVCARLWRGECGSTEIPRPHLKTYIGLNVCLYIYICMCGLNVNLDSLIYCDHVHVYVYVSVGGCVW